MSTPSESAETAPEHASARDAGNSTRSNFVASDSVSVRVGELVQQSADRTDFLKAFAAELVTQFRSGIVAVNTSDWNNPMMLVVDDRLSQQIERSALTGLLETATRSPIACSIPRLGNQSPTRGLRVELTESPNRAALLIVYPHDKTPGGVEQIRDLQRLGNYADCARTLIETLPTGIDGIARSSTDQTTLTTIHDSKSQLTIDDRRSLRSFHRDLDLRATCYRIANESRRMLRCDRVAVLVPRKGRFKVAAVSGVSVVDRRSNAVRAIESLTDSVVVLSRPLVVPCTDPLPPQIQQPLDVYLDESGVMSSVILPLHGNPLQSDQDHRGNDLDQMLDVDPFGSEGELVGVLVLEYFSGQSPAKIGPAMTTVASEATLALANSTEHRNVFGLSLWKAVGTGLSKTKAPIASALAFLAVGLIAAATIVPVDHYVIATGKIEPSIRREVFASTDGVVKHLHVVDGQQVNQGDPLLTLENAELESQAESLAGQIQTATERLLAMSAVRLSEGGDRESAARSSSSRLAMEERQLQSELANLRQQQEIVLAQSKQLVITAPIDGKIIAWQLQRRLMDRPVGRGNLLVSIVDPTGPWSLKLSIPDEDAGPVIESNEISKSAAVEFAVATLPNSTFKAELQSISTAARMDSAGGHVIDATANVTMNPDGEPNQFDSFDPSLMRSGADITAKIHCGQRSILRSWFGDVFDFVHRNILFYF